MMDELCEQLNNFAAVLSSPKAASAVLKEVFTYSGATYKEIADRSHVALSTVHDAVNGVKVPGIDTWAKIAEAITDKVIEESD